MIMNNMNKLVAASVNNSVMNNNFKEFNLDEAKKGAKLVTRDGSVKKFLVNNNISFVSVYGDEEGYDVLVKTVKELLKK